MRFKEFLVEYNRQVTANQVGNKVIMSLANDRSIDLSPFLTTLRRQLQGVSRIDPSNISAVIPPERLRDNINAILAEIETKDPTPNKVYTPWLAKMYAKAPGGLSIEDMNRMDFIRLYDLAKKRRMIKPEHADINRFKWYQDFEDAMEFVYNNLEDVEQSEENNDEGSASKMYEDDNVLVVVPHNEAAACKYGRGTRWCTSAKNNNMFDNYNRTGKLYILIPKNPQHDGEKYQLHFQSGSFMDEDDSEQSLSDIFSRFPGIKEFFIKEEPELAETVMFAPDDVITKLMSEMDDLSQECLYDALTEWEMNDEYYITYLKEQGCVDADGHIDWEEVDKRHLNYTEYNTEAGEWLERMEEYLKLSPDEIRYWSFELGDETTKITDLEILIAKIIHRLKSDYRRNNDGTILQDFLTGSVRIIKRTDKDGQAKYTAERVK